MDRRSWLWRRRSSEKNSGEAEGSGPGSGLSPPERSSDEQQANANQNAHSSEVTLKDALQDEDANDAVKILTEKLSAALASITAKEESVKQHSKVAEEAVEGWEKAEKEVTTLKQQLDVAAKKNSSLEDRIAQLDGALKECLRQLRQAQDQKIQEAINKKSQDLESDSELADLRSKLEIANSKAEAAASLESDLRLRLEITEKENASLKLQLHSQLQELDLMTLERDLSTKTAETASKQNLESIKKVAKLEAECRRLKTMLRKATSFSDHKSFSASPSHVESFTDSYSDFGERSTDCGQSHSDTWVSGPVEPDQFKNEKGASKIAVTPSPEINLMDDFLEMERLAALPARESRSCSLGSVTSIDKHTVDCEAALKAELETMINRTAELEEKVEMVEAEKVELQLTLTKTQDQLKLSGCSLRQLQAQFNESQNQLKISQAQLRDANRKMGMLQAELDLANELRQAIEMELEDANVRKEEAESQLRDVENECKLMISRVTSLEGEIEKERSLYLEISDKCKDLEDELYRMKHETDIHERELASMSDLKESVEQELASTNARKESADSQLKAVEAEVKSLLTKVSFLQDQAEKEKQASVEFSTKCKELEDELSRMKTEAESWKSQLASANKSKEAAEKEVQMTNSKREEVESQLQIVQAEARSLLIKVGSLEQELERERALAAELSAKSREFEEKLSKMKQDTDLQLTPLTKELKIQQEKELAVASNKLADCQKTIASLSNQLKSLALLEDLFSDSDNQLEVVDKDSEALNGVEVAGG